jgi:hypothetical protein
VTLGIYDLEKNLLIVQSENAFSIIEPIQI